MSNFPVTSINTIITNHIIYHKNPHDYHHWPLSTFTNHRYFSPISRHPVTPMFFSAPTTWESSRGGVWLKAAGVLWTKQTHLDNGLKLGDNHGKPRDTITIVILEYTGIEWRIMEEIWRLWKWLETRDLSGDFMGSIWWVVSTNEQKTWKPVKIVWDTRIQSGTVE